VSKKGQGFQWGSVSGSSYLNIRNVTLRGQVHPVSLIQLRPDHIVQISYLVILPNQRRCKRTISQGMTVSLHVDGRRTRQTELGMCFDGGHHATEHVCRDHVNLVQEYETPFSRRQKLHHLLGLIRPIVSVRDHRIRGDDDPAFTSELHVVPNGYGSITPRHAVRKSPCAPSLSDRL